MMVNVGEWCKHRVDSEKIRYFAQLSSAGSWTRINFDIIGGRVMEKKRTTWRYIISQTPEPNITLKMRITSSTCFTQACSTWTLISIQPLTIRCSSKECALTSTQVSLSPKRTRWLNLCCCPHLFTTVPATVPVQYRDRHRDRCKKWYGHRDRQD